MNQGRMVFAQVAAVIHAEQFRRCVRRYGGDYRVRRFSCWDQFLSMFFAQLTGRESLRDTMVCLRSRGKQLYSLGFRSQVSRSTLAEANETRDWRIYADLAQALIRKARRLYADEDLGMELDQTVYALDSTTIDLCLSLFPWAPFQQNKAAIKLHTLLDLRGAIPTVVHISDGRYGDIRVLDWLWVEPGNVYVMDRGYLAFERLYKLHQACAFFVIRAKKDLRFTRHLSLPRASGTGIRSDQIGRLAIRHSFRAYPESLRRIHYVDSDSGQRLLLLTNHRLLPALTVAHLYKMRWRVELFFKWIKQNLRIKAFYGTSDNAVKTQIWIAVCVYVTVAILRKELKIPHSLHTILQVLGVNVFEKIPIYQLLTNEGFQDVESLPAKQLNLWEF